MPISFIFPYIGYALFIAIWWPYRANNRFASVPWLLLAFAIGKIAYLLFRFLENANSSPSDFSAPIVQITAYTLFGIHAFVSILKSWMITANFSALVSEQTPGNAILQFFSRQNTFQRQFGITLVSLMIISWLFLGIQWLCGYPPHFK